MKHTAFFLIFITVFLASCSMEKPQSSEISGGIISPEKQEEMQNLNTETSETMNDDEDGEEKITEEDTENMMKNEEKSSSIESQTSATIQEEKSSENNSSIQSNENIAAEGIYSEYATNLVGVRENTVLFFHATWCPSCRAADAKILTETLPGNLAILKTDYDSQTELKKKYGVVTKHTFVLVDSEGNMIKKWVGGTSVVDIIEKLN